MMAGLNQVIGQKAAGMANGREELVNSRFGALGYDRQGLKVSKSHELDMESALVEIAKKKRNEVRYLHLFVAF